MSTSEEIVDRFSELYHDELKDKVTFVSFYLQELDAASIGGPHARAWAKSKPFDSGLYKGALETDDEGADFVQIQLRTMMNRNAERDKLKKVPRTQIMMDVIDGLYKRYVTDCEKYKTNNERWVTNANK